MFLLSCVTLRSALVQRSSRGHADYGHNLLVVGNSEDKKIQRSASRLEKSLIGWARLWSKTGQKHLTEECTHAIGYNPPNTQPGDYE